MKRLIVGGALGTLAAVVVSRTRDALGDRVDRLALAARRRTKRVAGSPTLDELPKDELYEQAKERDIPGRSTMTKDELVQALEDEA